MPPSTNITIVLHFILLNTLQSNVFWLFELFFYRYCTVALVEVTRSGTIALVFRVLWTFLEIISFFLLTICDHLHLRTISLNVGTLYRRPARDAEIKLFICDDCHFFGKFSVAENCCLAGVFEIIHCHQIHEFCSFMKVVGIGLAQLNEGAESFANNSTAQQ